MKNSGHPAGVSRPVVTGTQAGLVVAGFGRHVLVHPPGPAVLADYGTTTRCLTALFVPVDGFRFTPQ